MPREKIEALEAQLKSQGEPLRIADLKPELIPDAENAAPFYLQAYALLEALEFEGENLFYYKTGYGVEKIGEERREGLLTLLADPVYQEAMALVDEATSRPSCQFEVDYEAEARNLLIPHVSPLLGLASLIKVQVAVQLERGESTELPAALARLNGLALRLETEPFLISQLVRIAMIALYTETLTESLAKIEPSTALLQEIKSQLSRFPEEVISYNWITGERVFMLDFWRSGDYLKENGLEFKDIWDEVDSFSEGVMYLGAYLVPVWDELYFYERMLEMASLYTRPYHQIDWAREDQRFEEIPTPYFLSREALNIRRVREKMTSAKAYLQLAKAGVALYEIRLETGAFPEDLSGIPKEDCKDPFVGTSLNYAKTPDGFRLYSVGPNQIDEGGVKDRKTKEDDLLWRHPYGQ